ncbi:MAG: glycosyltransferase family 2 protein [Chitinophagaceae bacterium]
MQQPSAAIVILNWNGKKFLEQFLPSVLNSTYSNKRVIVADNASTDDSIVFVKNTFPTVEILTGNQNLGFAGGYNYFLKQVQADYYILLNSDVEVTPGWIEPIIELMENNASIAACQPKLLSWHLKNEFEYAGASGGWIDSLGYPFSRGRLFDVCEKDEGQYNTTAPVFWASGAALFIRAKCFHEMNGFDAFFFAHMEEIDLCWRLQRSGYQIYACPQSIVYHVGAGTLPKGSKRKVYLNFRNNLIMLTKNLPLVELLWKLPVRISLDAISAWKELLLGYPRYFKGVLTAHFSYAAWLFTKGKRFKAPYPPLKGVYKGSIIRQHFLKGRQKFSEIVNTK